MAGTTRLKSAEADSLPLADAVMLAAAEADADMEAVAETEADSIADEDSIADIDRNIAPGYGHEGCCSSSEDGRNGLFCVTVKINPLLCRGREDL